MSSRLDWRGDEVERQIAQRAANALDEINMRIEGAAKAELYPGHGVLTGTLRRSIHHQRARIEGDRIVGAVGTAPLHYAMVIHRRYRYLLNGLERVKGQAPGIVRKHMERGR